MMGSCPLKQQRITYYNIVGCGHDDFIKQNSLLSCFFELFQYRMSHFQQTHLGFCTLHIFFQDLNFMACPVMLCLGV